MIAVSRSNILCLGLLGLGVVAWHGAANSLKDEGLLKISEPNVLTLKGSPFGKTIAMAMQGPVDVYWHEGAPHEHACGTDGDCSGCGDCSHGHDHGDGHDHGGEESATGLVPIVSLDDQHDHGPQGHEHHDHAGCEHEGCEHGHGSAGHDQCPDGSCSGCQLAEAGDESEAVAEEDSVRARMLAQIQDWQAVANTRHNPHANSQKHKFYIRHEIEKKLHLTYRMDPTNYASYGAYFLFLSESSLTDRADRLEQALRLSQATVQACLAEEESATALLTGAAAAQDAVQMLILAKNEQANELAKRYSAVAENLLNDFEQLALQMAFDGTWDQFSALRQNEMSERARLLRRLVEANQKTPEINATHRSEEGDPETAG